MLKPQQPIIGLFDPAQHLAPALYIKVAETRFGRIANRVGLSKEDMPYSLPLHLPADQLVDELTALGYALTHRVESTTVAKQWGTGDGIPTHYLILQYTKPAAYAVPGTARVVSAARRPVVALLPARVPLRPIKHTLAPVNAPAAIATAGSLHQPAGDPVALAIANRSPFDDQVLTRPARPIQPAAAAPALILVSRSSNTMSVVTPNPPASQPVALLPAVAASSQPVAAADRRGMIYHAHLSPTTAPLLPPTDPCARYWQRSPTAAPQLVQLVETLPTGESKISIPGLRIHAVVMTSTLSLPEVQ